MKNIILCLTILFGLFLNVKSQDSEEVLYDISFDMKTLVYHTYRFTENVNVTRVFEDSTINKYSKSTTYWFTAFIPGDIDENGFLKVEISTDSMKYQFNSPNRNIDYSTQNIDQKLPISDMGFMNSFLSNNQKFDLVYSPYGNVAKIGGERLAKEREIHSKIEDIERRDFLLNSLSDATLTFKFDVTKGVFPSFQVTKDTSWKSEIELSVNNIPVSGIAISNFNGYSNNEYHILTELEDLVSKENPDKYFLPDLNKYGSVQNVVSTGELKTDLFTGGTIKYVRGNLKSLIEGELSNIKFKEIVESTYTWDLLKRFNY